jgi:hypothetical protein
MTRHPLLLIIAYHLLPAVFCLLPSAFCPLLSAYCFLLSAHCFLPTAFWAATCAPDPESKLGRLIGRPILDNMVDF